MKRSTILLACAALLTASCSKQEKLKAQAPVDDKAAVITISPAKADSLPLSQAPVVVKPTEEHEKEKLAEAVGLYPVKVDMFHLPISTRKRLLQV